MYTCIIHTHTHTHTHTLNIQYHQCTCPGLPFLPTGAPPAGPRVDGTGTFVPHSLLGEVEDFTAELQNTVSETTFNQTLNQLSAVSATWSTTNTSIACSEYAVCTTLTLPPPPLPSLLPPPPPSFPPPSPSLPSSLLFTGNLPQLRRSPEHPSTSNMPLTMRAMPWPTGATACQRDGGSRSTSPAPSTAPPAN